MITYGYVAGCSNAHNHIENDSQTNTINGNLFKWKLCMCHLWNYRIFPCKMETQAKWNVGQSQPVEELQNGMGKNNCPPVHMTCTGYSVLLCGLASVGLEAISSSKKSCFKSVSGPGENRICQHSHKEGCCTATACPDLFIVGLKKKSQTH